MTRALTRAMALPSRWRCLRLALAFPFPVIASRAVDAGGVVSSTVSEAWALLTPALVLGWIAAAALRTRLPHAERTRAPMRGTAVMLALHLATLPLLGWLDASGSSAYPTAHMAAATLATRITASTSASAPARSGWRSGARSSPRPGTRA